MNTWLKISLVALLGAGLLAVGRAGAAPDQPVAAEAAIQAIQQAPDPSAAVAAYSSGFAAIPNDPRLYNAFVVRMVDMGLPEMAFHQAQTLTTMQPNNGLGWGVVAYVDARRGQLPEAVSAINLAGQLAPTNTFVAHTAGEVMAWYDVKADKTKLPDNAKDGLTRTRVVLQNQPAYIAAYDTARKAYETQTSEAQPAAPTAPAQVAPAGQVTTAPAVASDAAGIYAPQADPAAQAYVPQVVGTYYAPSYYPAYSDWAPSYGYGWGPGWVAPSPAWWWYPCGYWGGSVFFPFSVTFAFGDYNHYNYNHGYGYHGGSGHYYGSGHAYYSTAWHGTTQGSGQFYGTQTHPNANLSNWNAGRTAGQTAAFANGSGTRGFAGAATSSSRGTWSAGTATSQGAGTMSRAMTATAPATHNWSVPQRTTATAPAVARSGSMPTQRAPTYWAPKNSAASGGSFGGSQPFRTSGGGFSGAARTYSTPAAPSSSGSSGGHSFGGGSRSGGVSGGASHGGGFGGGSGGGRGGTRG